MKPALLLLVVLHTGCVAPSLVIYGRGTVNTRTGLKTVAVPEVKIYGDLVGNTVIQGSLVTVTAQGGYENSTVIRETGKLIGVVGRSIVQPAIWGIVSAGTLNAAGGAASTAADAVRNP